MCDCHPYILDNLYSIGMAVTHVSVIIVSVRE